MDSEIEMLVWCWYDKGHQKWYAAQWHDPERAPQTGKLLRVRFPAPELGIPLVKGEV